MIQILGGDDKSEVLPISEDNLFYKSLVVANSLSLCLCFSNHKIIAKEVLIPKVQIFQYLFTSLLENNTAFQRIKFEGLLRVLYLILASPKNSEKPRSE